MKIEKSQKTAAPPAAFEPAKPVILESVAIGAKRQASYDMQQSGMTGLMILRRFSVN